MNDLLAMPARPSEPVSIKRFNTSNYDVEGTISLGTAGGRGRFGGGRRSSAAIAIPHPVDIDIDSTKITSI